MNRVLIYQYELDMDTSDGVVFSLKKQDERFQHIKKVLKLTAGAVFKAGIINGKKGSAEIITFSESVLTARFDAEDACIPLYPIRLILGFPRPIQLRRILRDIAGLGIESLYLTGTDLGEKSYLQADIAKPAVLERLLVDGCAQAGQTLIPTVHKAHSLQAFFSSYENRCTAKELRAVLDVPFSAECPDTPLERFSVTTAPLNHLPWQKKNGLWLAIGNERGWSSAERILFAQNGFRTYNMGSRILRTETAVTAALAVCLAQSGCWNSRPCKD